jgi:hypothetical protein
MYIQRIQFILILAVATLSCSEESPFLSEDEAKKIVAELNTERDPFHYMEDVVAIIDHDIYYFQRMDSVPKKLTNTPGQSKTHVKLSSDKTQIAYINGAGNPVIINATNGQHVRTLTEYNYIAQMDWAKDSRTLYFLIVQEIYSDGEPVAPAMQPEITHPWDEISSFSMNAKGDYAYFIKRYNDFSNRLIYHSESENIDEEYPSFEGDLHDYVDFYDNKGGFLLGYSDPFEDGFSRIICVEDYDPWAAYEWDYENMNTPEFNSDLEILLYGTMEDQLYQIKAVYLGTEAYDGYGLYDVLSMVLTEYTSESPIYLDWGH